MARGEIVDRGQVMKGLIREDQTFGLYVTDHGETLKSFKQGNGIIRFVVWKHSSDYSVED